MRALLGILAALPSWRVLKHFKDSQWNRLKDSQWNRR